MNAGVAIAVVWPPGSPDAEVRVKHTAARHLAGCAAHQDRSSNVAKVVRKFLGGTVQQLGIGKGLRQIFIDDPCFHIPDPRADEATIMLQLSVVQQMAVARSQQPSQHQQQQPAPSASSSSSSKQDAGQLAAAIDRVWPPGKQATGENRLRNAAARNLVTRAERRSLCSPLAHAVREAVGTTKMLGLALSFTDVLRADECFQFQLGPVPNEPAIVLDVPQLRRRAAALLPGGQQQQPPPPPPRAAAPAARHLPSGISAAQHQQLLLQHVSSRRWHDTSPQLDAARRALAVHMVQSTDAAAAGCCEILAAEAGLMSSLPYKHLPQAFAGDPFFECFMSGPTVRSVRLDISRLRQDMAAAAAAASSSQPGLSSSSGAAAAAAAMFEAAAAARMPPVPSNRQTGPQQQWQPAKAGRADVRVVPRLGGGQQAQAQAQQQKTQPPAAPDGAPQQQQDQQLQLPASGLLPLAAMQSLAAATPVNCALAEIAVIEGVQSSPGQYQQLQDLLLHASSAGLVALDVVLVAPGAAHSSSNSSSNSSSQVPALLQLLVPPASLPQQGKSWPCTIYALEVPEQQQAATQLLQRLHQLLATRQVVKVMHDARQAGSCLLQQCGISLAGVLDTQLLGGLTSLAAASSPAGVSSSNICGGDSWTQGLTRMPLGGLSQLCGVPLPLAPASLLQPQSNPGLWFKRPLPVQHLEVAADARVRYLLPLAHSLLLQQVPAALLSLSDMQLLLAQHGQAALQLKPQLLPGYRPLLQRSCSSDSILTISSNDSSDSLGAAATTPAAAAGHSGQKQVQHPGLTELAFELQAQHDSNAGWFRPRFVVYLNAEDHSGSREAAAAILAGVSGSSALLEEAEAAPDAPDDSSAAAEVAAAGPAAVWDAAVHSMAQLLPERVWQDLAPFISPEPGRPQLVEISADKNKPVTLRFADRTSQQLSYSIDPATVLARLAAAKWAPRQHHQQQVDCDAAGAATRASSSINCSTDGQSSVVDGSSCVCGQVLQLDAAGRACDSGSSRSSSSSSSSIQAVAAAPTRPVDGDDTGSSSGDAAAKRTCLLGRLLGSGLKRDGSSGRVVDGSDAAGGAAASPAADPEVAANSGRHDRLFNSDNRMGVPGTLHRISAMRNRDGGIYGLTFRIGRHAPGVALLLADLLSSIKASLDPDSAEPRPRSLLVLGRPGVGKTTLLRDIARLLSDPPAAGGLGLAVVIVDTSNEIAGDAEEARPCVGAARRMMVRSRQQQAEVLVQAVQNHTPDVVIVDEIGNKEEVAAARTIAQRGALLIGTAHGSSLRDLLANPELRPLVGGVQAVTLGDAAARDTNSGNKMRLERAGAATFASLLELRKKNEWCLHMDVEESVDIMLRSPEAAALAGGGGSSSSDGAASRPQGAAQGRQRLHTQLRSRDASGRLMVQFDTPRAAQLTLAAAAQVAELAGAAAPGTGPAAAPAAFGGGWLVDLLHAAVHRCISLGSA